MNIDIAQIENLISMYIELDEDSQEEVRHKVAELWSSKTCINSDNCISENQKGISIQQKNDQDEMLARKLKKMVDFSDMFKELDADRKAAMLIGVYELAGKHYLTEPKVKVTITYHSKSIKEIIAEELPEANIDHAYQLYLEAQRNKE